MNSATDHKTAAREALTLLAEAVRAEDWRLVRTTAYALAHAAKLVELSEREEETV